MERNGGWKEGRRKGRAKKNGSSKNKEENNQKHGIEREVKKKQHTSTSKIPSHLSRTYEMQRKTRRKTQNAKKKKKKRTRHTSRPPSDGLKTAPEGTENGQAHSPPGRKTKPRPEASECKRHGAGDSKGHGRYPPEGPVNLVLP